MLLVLVLIASSVTLLISSSAPCPQGMLECNYGWSTEDNMCIPNNKWCDSNCDCSKCEDENFCDTSSRDRCSFRGMFRCDNGACIPAEGECDGYPSCPMDTSDEDSCGCKKLRETAGTIHHSAIVRDIKRKGETCWDIEVPPNKYLILKFQRISMFLRDCFGSKIRIEESTTSKNENLFYICTRNSTGLIKMETFNNTKIIFPNGLLPAPVEENLIFEYNIADLLCKNSNSFKCNDYTCVEPEKKCDGNQDCSNGLDEVGCVKGVFKVEGINTSRQLGLQWLKNQRTEAWGWSQNTPRAVIAMYLANGAGFKGRTKEEDLTAKQLELQLSTAILRNSTDVITPSQLSMFINALLVICHDPKNFYGYDLVFALKKQVQSSKQFHPLSYLALCNAGVTLSQENVDKLFSVLDGFSQHGFKTEIEAIATLALSCVIQNNQFSHLKENLTSVTKSFKEMQNEDGSFGNLYTSALVIQALLASGEEEAKDWNLKAAVEFLRGKQDNEDGSFGDFFATYLVLPILNGKSLLDIGKSGCKENLKMPKKGHSVSDIDLKPKSKIWVHYFLCIGDQKDELHPIDLKVPENITVLEMMRLAAEADPKYRFKYETIMNKTYIYEIFGIINDPEEGKFWLLHTGKNEYSDDIETRSADEISVYDQEYVIMWYKSAQLL